MRNFYQHYSGLKVSKDGEVFVPKSVRQPAHYTIGSKRLDGHRYVSFKRKYYYVHILVAEVFLNNNEPISKGYDVHHINHIPDDNRVENLVILTRPEHSRLHMTGAENPKSKPVLGISKTTGEVREFASVGEAGRTLGIHHSNIFKCIKGIRTHSGGYYWQYA